MDSAPWPRVAVVGAGAVGGYFGGMLIVNAALNAISAVVQVPYGRVVATPDERR